MPELRLIDAMDSESSETLDPDEVHEAAILFGDIPVADALAKLREVRRREGRIKSRSGA